MESRRNFPLQRERSRTVVKEGGRNFPNNAALLDWLFLPTFGTIFLWGAEAASFLINRFPLGGSWASGTSSFRTKLRTQKRERELGEEQNGLEPTEDGSFGTVKEIKKLEHKSHFMFVDSCSTTFTPWTRLRGKSGKLSNCVTCLILIWWHLSWKCKGKKIYCTLSCKLTK